MSSNDGVCETADTGSLEAKAMTRLAGREACRLSGLPGAGGFGRDEREARGYVADLVGDADADRMLEELRAKTNGSLEGARRHDTRSARAGDAHRERVGVGALASKRR
jgi:hypothetical protein